MDFKVLTAEEYQDLKQDIACLRTLFVGAVSELKKLKDNRLMDINEVMEYTGFGKSWLMEHKNDIGYMQVGSSPLRFYKEDVDKYFLQHKIQRKHK